MIEVAAVTKRFATAEALRGLSFAVDKGEIFGFVGPNGAGKTTTIKILATLMSPTSGTVRLGDVDLVAHPGRARDLIGYVPDFFGVYDALTAAEYLAFYASCYGIGHRRAARIVDDLLELIGLNDKRDVPVDVLSRGMKQRLCLARALVHDPAVLLLDEPASGLDPRGRADMRELLRELRRMGKTIVISSHILPELAEMCTTFGIIDRGRIVASGSLDDLTGQQGRRRVRVEVLGDAEEQARRVATLPGVTAAELVGEAIDLLCEGGDDELTELLASMVGGGIRVRSFVPVDNDLESIFLRLTSADPEAA
jgi:ABC-2 type transport system ATP-binding protein